MSGRAPIHTRIPLDLYPKAPIVVGNFSATPHQLDCLAGFYRTRSLCQTADLLGLTSKGVSSHLRNFRFDKTQDSLKISEGILRFLDSSGSHTKSLLTIHYQHLLVEKSFRELLKKLVVPLKNRRIHYILDIGSYEWPFIRHLENHLLLGGITPAPKETDANLETYYKLQIRQKPTELSGEESSSNNHPCLMRFLSPEGAPHKTFEAPIGKGTAYYDTLLELIAFLLPTPPTHLLLEEFKGKKKNILSEEKRNNSPFKNDSPFPSSHLSRGKKFLWYTVILCIVLFMSSASMIKDKFLGAPFIRSDLRLPEQGILLKRPKLIRMMGEKLSAGEDSIKSLALVGVGGSGKTILARYYAKEYGYSVTWEINAETKETMIASFEDLAYALSATEEEREFLKGLRAGNTLEERESRILDFVKKHLKKYPSWMLIYDNVEHYSDIRSCFPRDATVWGKGQVIVTTQDETISSIQPVLRIQELTKEEKIDLFKKITKYSNSSFSPLSKLESFLESIPSYPLDVWVAASYITATGISYEKYRQAIEHYSSKLSSTQEEILRETTDYAKTRYNIITLSLKRLIEANQKFEGLLLLISLLDSQNIPRELLDLFENEDLVNNFVYHLRKYSLLSNDGTDEGSFTNTITIHRSTQEISRFYLMEALHTKKERLLQKISLSLEEYIARILEKDIVHMMKPFIIHCEAFLKHASLLPEAIQRPLKIGLASLHVYSEEPLKTKEILETILAQFKENTNNDRQAAEALTYLGIAYTHLGDYEKARCTLERSASLYKSLSLDCTVGAARTFTELGNVYRHLGAYKKAKGTLKQGMKLYKTYFPTNQGGIARNLRFLGCVYRDLTRYEKAKVLLEKSLGIYKKYLPLDYNSIAWVLTTLGTVYRELGWYKQAKVLTEESLKIYEKTGIGKERQKGWVKSNLGRIYREIGDFKTAKALLEESLKTSRKFFSPYHSSTAWSLGVLGIIHTECSDYSKAMSFLMASLKVYDYLDRYKRLYGEDNIRVAWVQRHLGNIYKKTGQYALAKGLFHQSLLVHERNCGKIHVDVARILRDLGETYSLEGDFETASTTLEKSLKMFGVHPDRYKVLTVLSDHYFRMMQSEPIKKNPKTLVACERKAMSALIEAFHVASSYLPEGAPHLVGMKKKLQQLEASVEKVVRHEF